MIEVLLADDQSLVRDGFRALIDREPDLNVVAEAVDGVEAIDTGEQALPGRRTHGHPDAQSRRAGRDPPGARGTAIRPESSC